MITAQRSYQIERSRDDIRQILTDLRLYGRFHPLIVHVSQLGKAHPGYTDFKILERPWPVLPFSIEYAVRVQSEAQDIRYQISGIPLHLVQFYYRLIADHPGFTTVHLMIQINGCRYCSASC